MGANSPSLCPTIASVTKTGTCLRPSCTAIVCPSMSGMIVERRNQVRITFLVFFSFCGVHLLEQVVVDERALLQAAWHVRTPPTAQRFLPVRRRRTISWSLALRRRVRPSGLPLRVDRVTSTMDRAEQQRVMRHSRRLDIHRSFAEAALRIVDSCLRHIGRVDLAPGSGPPFPSGWAPGTWSSRQPAERGGTGDRSSAAGQWPATRWPERGSIDLRHEAPAPDALIVVVAILLVALR